MEETMFHGKWTRLINGNQTQMISSANFCQLSCCQGLQSKY